MKKNSLKLVLLAFFTSLTINVFAGGAKNHDATFDLIDCPGDDAGEINDHLSCYSLKGWSKGNHELDCTVIIPTVANTDNQLPLIAWANGWEQGNVLGQCTTNGYLRGLKDWSNAGGGRYIIAAANQWSVQESDVLACVQWVVDNDIENGGVIPVRSEYIGLAGHSQGGGAVIKAGNGTSKGPEISAVLAMNPYGPSWVNSGNQDGPVFILGGRLDTTTPPESYEAVWEAISAEGMSGGPGGINAVLSLGTHNSEAWNGNGAGGTLSCEEAAKNSFGAFQNVGLLWWEIQLWNMPLEVALKALLDVVAGPWEQPTRYSNF